MAHVALKGGEVDRERERMLGEGMLTSAEILYRLYILRYPGCSVEDVALAKKWPVAKVNRTARSLKSKLIRKAA